MYEYVWVVSFYYTSNSHRFLTWVCDTSDLASFYRRSFDNIYHKSEIFLASLILFLFDASV